MSDFGPAVLLLVAMVGLGVGLTLDHQRDSDRLEAFHTRCAAQGGVVLDSTKRSGGKQIGCYSGVKELPNEG